MSAEVTVRVDREGADPEEVRLVLDLDHLTMREAVRMEEVLGVDTFASVVQGGLRTGEAMSPRIVQALLYTKLKTLHPDVTLDSFDVDLGELGEALEGEDPKAEPSGDVSTP